MEQLPPSTARRRRHFDVLYLALRILLVGTAILVATQLSAQSSSNGATGASIAGEESGTLPLPTAPQTKTKATDELAFGWKQVRQMFQGLAGIPMWALIGCSIVLLMFVVDRCVVLQKSRVVPRPFTTRMIQHMREDALSDESAHELIAVCREHGSPISAFFAIVLENRGRSAFEIRTAVGDEADTEIYKLKKHIRAIGALANLAPLLGLFGTVIGMIDAFRSLSQQQGGQGKSELLAQGISLALVATASGLGVAIVASAFYYYLQGKFEQRIQDLDLLTNQAVSLMAGKGNVSRTPRESTASRK